ncbi:lipopolysaccharide 1,6-galactosyltransferase [Sporolactobacillus sp. THM7-4]|nr:lipopolysaccharide 1,6-galactosyltransferase [Sporolactobacillus sp. THM7-4]
MKKIMFVLPHVSGKGGIETVVKTVVNEFKEKKIFNSFLLILGGSDNKVWLNGLNVNYRETAYLKSKELRIIPYLYFIFKYVKQEKPDVIIGLSPVMCLLLKLVRKITDKKFTIVSWIHFSLNIDMIGNKKKLIKYADYHLSISTGITTQLIDLGINPSRIFTIFNPVEPTKKTIPRPRDMVVFVYIGRVIFEGQKRLKDLLTALSSTNEKWKLEVIGDGKDLKLCKQYSKQLKINDKIVWHGWLSNPWERVNLATALVLTSEYEGLPMVLAEAISRGIYCISSDCETGPRDIIRQNVNGELYQPGNLDQLSQILRGVTRGKVLPDQNKMKSSIENLYINNYINNFVSAISSIDR